ncbi:MAG: NTP transferase domain-containing protein [Muribaculaceae bacterium]|nr:NTP transferase domain-containing protein [Muribaculaceae bacterium]
MKAMILAAGLGTRLKPWTLQHPKALVPVGGVPMLERVINSLSDQGFSEILINIHHFGEQILDFLNRYQDKEKPEIKISDERDELLDTGGGLLEASKILFSVDDTPFLVHNVDILSNADLSSLMDAHLRSGNDVTMLTSGRESSRKLIFDDSHRLKGWHNLSTGEFKPSEYVVAEKDHEAAFSGIYIIGKKAVDLLKIYSEKIEKKSFPIMNFFLSNIESLKIGEFYASDLKLIDIGKPATLEKANKEFINYF